MKRVLAQTFLIQGIGIVLMFGTTIIVSRTGGAMAQGSFALVKSMNDLQVGVLSFGLPSAIVFMLNRTGTGHRAVAAFARNYTLGLLLVLPILNYGILAAIMPDVGSGTRLMQAMLIGWAAALLTGFAMFRAILLVHTDGPVFSLVSIVQWLVIALAVSALINRAQFTFELAYLLAGVISVSVILGQLRRYQPVREGDDGTAPIEWSVLRSQSAHVFLQSILFGLQPFATNAALEAGDPSLSSAGLFNIASMVVTLPNLLVALVAPVLFNRWSKSLDQAGYRKIRRNALVLAAGAQVLALLSLPLVSPVIALVFGEAFRAAAPMTAILLLSVFAVFAGRILTPALQGLGFNRVVTWSCLARAACAGLAGASAFALGQGLLDACAIAWLCGEFAALIVLLAAPSCSVGPG